MRGTRNPRNLTVAKPLRGRSCEKAKASGAMDLIPSAAKLRLKFGVCAFSGAPQTKERKVGKKRFHLPHCWERMRSHTPRWTLVREAHAASKW